MKHINLLLAVTLSLVSLSAVAGMGEVEGNTICTDIEPKAKKIIATGGCSYTGSVGASMSYSITELDFMDENADNFGIVDNTWFERDNKGNVTSEKTTVTLNGLEAETLLLKNKTLKEISKEEIEKRYKQSNPKFSDVLYCYSITEQDYDAATCVPYDMILNLS